MQQLRLLDKDRNLLAIFDRHAGWKFESKINEASSMQINIPKNDTKLESVKLAELIRIIKGDRVITGKITKKEQGDQVVTLKAMTEEILLESNICPAQYGLVYQNVDLADFARNILKGWETLRVKYQSEWQDAIETYQVDLDTLPGKVILQKDENGQYYSDGYITLRFDSNNIENFEKWDRARWVSDNSDPVSSTIQYRTGNDTSNMGTWSAEVVGALTDQLGVALSGITDRYVDIRINLYTDDTTSADNQGQPVGVTPIAFALEIIARTTAEVQEGIIPISTGKKVKNISADNSNALELLVPACNQAGWEFEVVDGKLNLAEKLGEDRTNDFVLRNGTNINVESLGEDDSKLCNLLHAYGPGDGINRPYVKRKDDTSIGRYGHYPKTLEFDAVDKQDLEQKAQTYINAHKTPISEFKVQAIFPKENEPYFAIGDTVKVVDPESQIVTTARIMQEKRIYNDKGIEIELHLNNPRKSLYDALVGDEEKSDSDELELTVPQGLRVLPAQPGLLVYVNPYTNSRATGVEIHIGTSSGFEASSKTLIRKGQGTQWYLNKLTTGNRYYIKARSYDVDKNYSDFTEEVSAIAGFIEKQQLNPELSQDIDYAKSEADVVQANKDAWNLARDEVFPEGIENTSSITENEEEISNMLLTLNSDNDDPAQFSSIKQTAESILNIVSVLESDPEDANQYSAIKQMLNQIQLRVVKDELISQINLSPESVKIQGNRIVITGDTVVEDGALSTEKLIVGQQIPMRKPNAAQLFHFDRSFLSTDGVQAQFSDSSYQLIEGKFGKALDLQTSSMSVPLGFTNDYTIVFYFWDGSDWVYVAKRSDGRVFSWRIIELWSVWGIPGYQQEILNVEIDVSWINIDANGDLQVNAGYKIDELMIVPEVVDEDSIYSWYKSDAPFVDSQSVIGAGKGDVIISEEGIIVNNGKLQLNGSVAPDAGDVSQAAKTADWHNVTGTGKPADNADKTSENYSKDQHDFNNKSGIAGQGGVILDANGIRSKNDQFKIDTGGNAYFGGELRAAKGTFEGTLNANELQVDGTLTVDARDGSGLEVINGDGIQTIDGTKKALQVVEEGEITLSANSGEFISIGGFSGFSYTPLFDVYGEIPAGTRYNVANPYYYELNGQIYDTKEYTTISPDFLQIRNENPFQMKYYYIIYSKEIFKSL
ncbi:phage tail protein [Orenia marismortui]|uniref:phage tail protein n=1 Tax=Orenia marismortui TaxID=46469 RepID=UPI0003743A82|nr:phage tail protein [Orenia marismortui]